MMLRIRGLQGSRRRGVVLVLTAICLAALLGMAALSVDVGYIYGWAHHAQNTADAGALAGASSLREQDWTTAYERAMSVVERNQKAFGYYTPENVLIEMGEWDRSAKVFRPLIGTERSRSNAVHVVSEHPKVRLFFARILGKRTVEIAREAVALVGRPCDGIWGLESATVSGNVVTDSYDSSASGYSSVLAAENGDVCSGGPIDVGGSLDIHGDLMAGLDYEVTVKGSAANITGSTTTGTDILEIPETGAEQAALFNDNDLIPLTDGGADPFVSPGNLKIPGNDNLNLPEGTYYLQSFTMVSGSTMKVLGPVTLYIMGSFSMEGSGIVNTTMDPSKLMLISLGENFDMGGSVAFYGSILAPNADVELSGTADIFGAIIAKSLDFSGDFNFHVDESSPLMGLLKPGPPVLVR